MKLIPLLSEATCIRQVTVGSLYFSKNSSFLKKKEHLMNKLYFFDVSEGLPGGDFTVRFRAYSKKKATIFTDSSTI
jgi:hypothetical protein